MENLDRLSTQLDYDMDHPECWVLNSLNKEGYSQIKPVGSKDKVYGHHFAYALLVGGWRQGQEVHHRCQNRRCVNPAHLEPIYPKKHYKRKRARATTKPLPTFRNSDAWVRVERFALDCGVPWSEPDELAAAA